MPDKKVVKAIDVGFGNVKFTQLVVGTSIQCSMFPSIAPQVSVGPEFTQGVMSAAKTVTVEVNGIHYVVGKDARLAQDTNYSRILDTKYAATDIHLALIRGALFYMGSVEVDVLVLGLPVNTHTRYADYLIEKIKGEHPIPFKSGPQKCRIHNVGVLPQPIGAFFDYATQPGGGKMLSENNLLVDAGYYTLDWVVAFGTKVNNARSGAANGGMSAVLRVITDAIGKELNEQINDTHIVDEALREGRNPKFYGIEMDITSHIQKGRAEADLFVNKLVAKVGDGIDISNIIISGGGAEFFLKSLQKRFPRHKITTTPDPLYANVRGFCRAGLQWAATL